jgi:TPR repeat protein
MHGTGTEKNLDLGIIWYIIAAENGDPEAQTTLNEMLKNNVIPYAYFLRLRSEIYLSGDYVKRSVTTAVEYLCKAAELGDLKAQCILGSLCIRGEGVPQSAEEGVRWFSKAAEQKYPDALYLLSLCYSSGIGVAVDKDKAKEYLKAAAELNQPDAIEQLKSEEQEKENAKKQEEQ